MGLSRSPPLGLLRAGRGAAPTRPCVLSPLPRPCAPLSRPLGRACFSGLPLPALGSVPGPGSDIEPRGPGLCKVWLLTSRGNDTGRCWGRFCRGGEGGAKRRDARALPHPGSKGGSSTQQGGNPGASLHAPEAPQTWPRVACRGWLDGAGLGAVSWTRGLAMQTRAQLQGSPGAPWPGRPSRTRPGLGIAEGRLRRRCLHASFTPRWGGRGLGEAPGAGLAVGGAGATGAVTGWCHGGPPRSWSLLAAGSPPTACRAAGPPPCS